MAKVLDWIDPGNAGGSVRVPDAPRSEPTPFLCRFCGLPFDTELDRTNHVHEKHPLLQPVLLLDGVPAAQRTIVRRPLRPADVAFEECTSIIVAVDGHKASEVTANAAAAALARSESAFITLLLRNSQAESSYAIRISIPREEDLDAVDSAFRAHLAHSDVSLGDVDRFRSVASKLAASEDYTSALADYVFGVLIKDQSAGTSLPFNRYKDKLQAAGSVLEEFSGRSLPLAILQCVRFNLNEFDRVRPSGVADLDRAFDYFAEKAGGRATARGREQSTKRRPAVALCPVDETTAALTASLSGGIPQVGRDMSHLQDLEARASSALTSDPDKIKLYVVIADAFVTREDHANALPYLARLEHDYTFGRWAAYATKAGADDRRNC